MNVPIKALAMRVSKSVSQLIEINEVVASEVREAKAKHIEAVAHAHCDTEFLGGLWTV